MVVVEGINIASATPSRASTNRRTKMPQIQSGGILELAQPLDVSNVMLVCPSCGQSERIKHVLTEVGANLRACAHCGQSVAREDKA